MPCIERYSSAYEYASFWCRGKILAGVHAGAGPADAALSDPVASFAEDGVRSGAGMTLFNLTQNTSGYVIAVTAHTLTATGVTWNIGDSYQIVPLTASEVANLEHWLDVAAGDVHAALAATDQCDCTWSAWGADYAKKLNIIDAASYPHCRCGKEDIGARERQNLLDWMSAQLAAIADGTIDLCEGATGKNWPALGYADQAYTEFQAAEMIIKDWDRVS